MAESRDHLSPEKRSWNMSRIRSKDTKPELIIRKRLFAEGFRYRIHAKDLPGKPDLVFPRRKTVIFVHGCFWHRHDQCRRCTTPTKDREFWEKKFARTVQRDQEEQQALKSAGWKVLVIWECEINRSPDEVVRNVSRELRSA